MQASSNKTIAKNTLFLYFRMALVILVGLYSSRVILNALGVEDYGIYNVAGSVVSMFVFLNGALGGASSRFITVELGKSDERTFIGLIRCFATTRAMVLWHLLLLLLPKLLVFGYFIINVRYRLTVCMLLCGYIRYQ